MTRITYGTRMPGLHQSERQFQAAVIEYARSNGWRGSHGMNVLHKCDNGCSTKAPPHRATGRGHDTEGIASMQTQTTCAVDGCENPVLNRRGWCNRHYLRWRRTGDPLGSTRKPITINERFWSKVDRNGPVPTKCPELGRCWLWTAGGSAGYGTFNRGPGRGQWILAHRFAYEQLIGPIPPDRGHLHHRCETPSCVNPDHLKPVTYIEHGLEHRSTHCRRGHDLTEHGCYRKDRTHGLVYCRACRREDRRQAA